MSDQPAQKPSEMSSKGPLGLIVRLVTLTLGTAAVLLAIVLLIPDANDYAKATLLKHERLASLEGRKVVLVGGSNLSYGMDSDIIERETGCPTVNMGMNGYFGPRYMLNEVKDSLKSGDIVVLAFEWDNYGKSVDGTGKDLYVIAKTNPSAIAYFTPAQMLMAAKDIPYIAQTKLFRVINQTVRGAVSPSAHASENTSNLLDSVESLRSFGPKGDLNGHEGVEWTTDHEEGSDLNASGIDDEIVPLIQSFARDMKARGVTVVMSYTPTMRHYYEAQSSPINAAHQRLTSGPDAVNAPRPPEAYVFDRSYFFDTVYHLKTTTRGERSQMVADDIHTVLGNTPDCRNTLTH